MEGEAKCNTNGTNDKKKYLEYVHKHMKGSIGLAYRRRIITGI